MITNDATEPIAKRRKTHDNAIEICVICKQEYMHKDKLLRHCETDRANVFISASRLT